MSLETNKNDIVNLLKKKMSVVSFFFDVVDFVEFLEFVDFVVFVNFVKCCRFF